jgi:hypothetical protein
MKQGQYDLPQPSQQNAKDSHRSSKTSHCLDHQLVGRHSRPVERSGQAGCSTHVFRPGASRTVLLPFYLLADTIRVLTRLSCLAVGFTFMVAGMAFWAGSFLLLAIPLFVIGLLMTLRSLR